MQNQIDVCDFGNGKFVINSVISDCFMIGLHFYHSAINSYQISCYILCNKSEEKGKKTITFFFLLKAINTL